MDVKKTCYLFFDFDGTITVKREVLQPDGTVKRKNVVPEENVNAIKAAQALGHKIFLCTGRSRGSILPVTQAFEIPWNGMICGASDMWFENERISISFVPETECFKWFDYCVKNQRLFNYNGSEQGVPFDFRNAVSQNEISKARAKVKSLFAKNPLTNISINPSVDPTTAPESELSVINLPTYSDLFAPGCNKGTAIQKFCRLIGAPIEQTVCFGDSSNDIDMFCTCPTSICMKDAPDLLKETASYVAKEPCGVAEGLRFLFGDDLIVG